MLKGMKFIVLVGLLVVGIVGMGWTGTAWAARAQREVNTQSTLQQEHHNWQGAPLVKRLISATAYTSGITFDEVVDELNNGKSMAQVADEHGQSGDAVTQYVKDHAANLLNEAVAVDLITRSTKFFILQKLDARMDELIHDTELKQFISEHPIEITVQDKREDKWHGIIIARLISATAYQSGISFEQAIDNILSGKSMAQVAETYGTNGDDIVQYVSDGVRTRLDEAVAIEKMTPERADELHQNLTNTMTDIVNDPDMGLRISTKQQKVQDVVVGGMLVYTTADQTGVPYFKILQSLRNGETLAQIAEANGTDGETIIQTAETAVQKRLDNAVEAGRMTQDEADQKVQTFRETADSLIDQTLQEIRDDWQY